MVSCSKISLESPFTIPKKKKATDTENYLIANFIHLCSDFNMTTLKDLVKKFSNVKFQFKAFLKPFSSSIEIIHRNIISNA